MISSRSCFTLQRYLLRCSIQLYLKHSRKSSTRNMASNITNLARQSPLAGRFHLKQMKEAIVSKGPTVTIHEVPIPSPSASQVLIKVIYSGSNPKDWKGIEYWSRPSHNSGDDIAGIVESVGENVIEFQKGDRVAAFHEMQTPHGSFAEYAIAESSTTFHLPNKTSFEEASTIPLAAMTAAVGLYQHLGLPEPWRPTTTPTPLVVYGASSAVGAFAIKLAQLSNIHPIIAVAGRGDAFVETLLTKSKGDTIVDYRKGDDAVISGVKEALSKTGFNEVKYAYDAISEHNSYRNLSQILAKEGSKITLVLPAKEGVIAEYIEASLTRVGSVHQNLSEEQVKLGIKTGSKEFGYVFFRFFSRGLQEGWFTGHPYEVVPGGLNGVEKGLTDLKNGVNSASKYIFKIEDTK